MAHLLARRVAFAASTWPLPHSPDGLLLAPLAAAVRIVLLFPGPLQHHWPRGGPVTLALALWLQQHRRTLVQDWLPAAWFRVRALVPRATDPAVVTTIGGMPADRTRGTLLSLAAHATQAMPAVVTRIGMQPDPQRARPVTRIGVGSLGISRLLTFPDPGAPRAVEHTLGEPTTSLGVQVTAIGDVDRDGARDLVLVDAHGATTPVVVASAPSAKTRAFRPTSQDRSGPSSTSPRPPSVADSPPGPRKSPVARPILPSGGYRARRPSA